MNNAAAAYYLYLARCDRETARVMRACGGYHASADYVEARAQRYERMAKGAAPLTDAAPSPSQDTHGDTDLHTPSYG